MKILLTGATGFIGSALLRLGLSRGHQFAGLVIPNERLPSTPPAGKNLTWLRGTLQKTPWSELEAFGADTCIHTAWITTPGVYLESPENERFRDASLAFLRRLTELGTRHLLGLGTCIEYQLSRALLSEAHTPLAPATRYARCKNELRAALEAESKPRGFEMCWARIFYLYGPGEGPTRLCSSLIAKLSRNEPLMLSTPSSTKDYVFIDDVARALLLLAEQRAQGAFNVGTGVGITVWELAQELAQMLNRADLVRKAVPETPDPLGYVVADSTKLRSLGWKPEVDLPHGLGKLLAAVGQRAS